MSTLLAILHIIVSLFLMLTVLLQSGKGGGMGAAFGGGNAATVFGGSGASSFLRRLTATAATIFMITSMVLAYLASHNTADALEKFGKQQDELRVEKEAATQSARDQAAKNNGSAGSGSAAQGSGSAAQGSGSAVTPAAGSGSDSKGSAANPAIMPDKPVNGSAATPEQQGTNGAVKADDKKTNPATIPDSMSPATGSNTKKVNDSVTKPDEKPTKPVSGPAKLENKPEKPAETAPASSPTATP